MNYIQFESDINFFFLYYLQNAPLFDKMYFIVMLAIIISMFGKNLAYNNCKSITFSR